MKWIRIWALAGALLAPPLQAESLAGENAIEAIQATRQGNEIIFRVDLREPLAEPPAGFVIANPAKIAFDFPSTVNGLGKNAQAINEGDLRSVNVVQAGERTRLVMNLVQKMNYRTRLEGRSLYVNLLPIASQMDSVASRTTKFAEERLFSERHAIHDILFRRGKDGEGRVLIELSDAGTGIDIRQQGSTLVVDFSRTLLPEHLQRKLDVADFATPIMSVESKINGEHARLTITPKGLWEHTAYQTDNQLVVEVRRLQEDPNKLVQGNTIGYQGPRVSINYQNGDVRALLRLMAEELGLNAVISETVTGTTTLVLKDVPADQVIEIIFQQKGLDMRKKGNIVMIAPRDEIGTREKLELETKQQISELEAPKMEQFVLNYQKATDVARLLLGLPVAATTGGATVAPQPAATGSAAGMAQRILSKRGHAVGDPHSNLLFVSDIPSKLEEIRSFIRAIDVGARQVLIEARVVEANDTFNKELGVRLGFLNRQAQQIGNSGIGIGGGSYAPPSFSSKTTAISSSKVGDSSVKTESLYSPGDQASPTALGVNLPVSNPAGTIAFSIFNSSLTRILNLELSALESDGVGKIVSAPRVVTANNVKAKIEDGTEIPYTATTSSGGAITQTVTFKSAKLSLEVTPQITPEGNVRMGLVVKKEEPDYSRLITTVTGDRYPPIKSSVVETNAVVDNGGTVVIGGVFITKNENGVDKVPVLGDVPFLGWLFKSKVERADRRELLVFITPRIISDKVRVD